MKFTKTYSTIQIDEKCIIYKLQIKEAYLGTAVPGLKGIVANLEIVPKEIGDKLFKELAICIHLYGRLRTKLLEKAIGIMFRKLAEEKEKMRKQKKKYKLFTGKNLWKFI
jgi:hypothetical protein